MLSECSHDPTFISSWNEDLACLALSAACTLLEERRCVKECVLFLVEHMFGERVIDQVRGQLCRAALDILGAVDRVSAVKSEAATAEPAAPARRVLEIAGVDPSDVQRMGLAASKRCLKGHVTAAEAVVLYEAILPLVTHPTEETRKEALSALSFAHVPMRAYAATPEAQAFRKRAAASTTRSGNMAAGKQLNLNKSAGAGLDADAPMDGTTVAGRGGNESGGAGGDGNGYAVIASIFDAMEEWKVRVEGTNVPAAESNREWEKIVCAWGPLCVALGPSALTEKRTVKRLLTWLYDAMGWQDTSRSYATIAAAIEASNYLVDAGASFPELFAAPDPRVMDEDEMATRTKRIVRHSETIAHLFVELFTLDRRNKQPIDVVLLGLRAWSHAVSVISAVNWPLALEHVTKQTSP